MKLFTCNFLLVQVLLSAYPKYTLSFALAHLFPATAQAYYDALLEPLFNLALPRIQAPRGAKIGKSAAAMGLVLGDLLLAAGFAVFVLGPIAGAGALVALGVAGGSLFMRGRRRQHAK